MSESESRVSDSMPLLILGMHRSGTSLVADMFRRGGVFLGDEDDLAEKAEDNLRGFFENLEIRVLNDELLHRLGGTWRSPPEAESLQGAVIGPAFADLRDRARSRVDKLRTANPLWGWKDPRTSLLLPFWRGVVPEEMRLVVCVRDPRSIADSLAMRDGIPRTLALFLWQEYLARLLNDLEGTTALVVSYSEVLRDPVRQAERMAAFLAPSSPPLDVKEMAGGVEPSLRHHNQQSETRFESPWEGGEALWAHLQKCALDDARFDDFRPDPPPRDASFIGMMRDSGALATRLAESENQVRNKAQELRSLGEKREQLEGDLAQTMQRLEEERREARTALEASRSLLEASQEHLFEVNRAASESLDRARILDATLQQVFASRGWRALEWLRGWKRVVVRDS